MIAIMILWNSGPPWFDAWNVNELSWIRCVTIEVLTDSFLLCSNGKDVFLSRCGRRILLTIYQCKCSYYKRDGQSSEPVGSCTTLGDFLYRISLQEALYNTLMKSSLYFFFFSGSIRRCSFIKLERVSRTILRYLLLSMQWSCGLLYDLLLLYSHAELFSIT